MVHWRHIQAKTALLLLAQFMAVLGKFKTCGTLASYPGKDSTASLGSVHGCVREVELWYTGIISRLRQHCFSWLSSWLC